MVELRPFGKEDVAAMCEIWNEVVAAGKAFPQTDLLDPEAAEDFFASQTKTVVAVDESRVLGVYILHPNDVGRKAHVGNASFAVSAEARGRGVGRMLVADALESLSSCGFRAMQFNAVVASNAAAIHLYESLGMRRVGTIPEGFRSVDGYEDMHIYYYEAR